MEILGSCLCGELRYRLFDSPRIMNLCHCSMCRKSSGSTYGTFAHVNADDFTWLTSTSSLTRYEASPNEYRAFCLVCGSPMPYIDGDAESICIPAGSFDSDPQKAPSVELFLGSKAPWYEKNESIAGFEEYAPDDFEDE